MAPGAEALLNRPERPPGRDQSIEGPSPGRDALGDPTQASESPPRALLVGLGNPILTDDGVGVRLATDLAPRLAADPRTRTVDVRPDCAVGGLELLDVLAGYRRVIIVDAIKTTDGVPGDWYHFSAEALRETLNLRNVHDTNLATALELGRRLGMEVAPDSEIHVIAVEAEDVLTFSDRLSPPLEGAYAVLLSDVTRTVEEIVTGD